MEDLKILETLKHAGQTILKKTVPTTQTTQTTNPKTNTSPTTTHTPNPTTLNSLAIIDNRPWTSLDIGQNAISTLLNDPSTHSILNSKIGEKLEYVSKQMGAIPKTSFKVVKEKDFDIYLGAVGEEIRAYQELLRSGEESHTKKGVKKEGNSKEEGKENESNNKNMDIEEIPKIFFQQDFNLENPKIFQIATEGASIASSTPSILHSTAATTQNTTSNTLLQDKLSHYLDLVEVCLIKEIGERSPSFFEALHNIDLLKHETRQSISQIQLLRHSLKHLNQQQYEKSLDLMKKEGLRRQLFQIRMYLNVMKELKAGQPMIQIYLNQGDYLSALDLIQDLEHLLIHSDSEQGMGVEMKGIRVLGNMEGQLLEVRRMIGAVMEEELVGLLMGVYRDFSGDKRAEERPFFQWASNSLTAVMTASTTSTTASGISNDVVNRLQPLLKGLLRVEKCTSALGLYRDRLLKLLKQLTKQYFPPDEQPAQTQTQQQQIIQSGHQKQQSEEGVLQKRFIKLSNDAYFDLLKHLFMATLQVFRVMENINTLILGEWKSSAAECFDVFENGVQYVHQRVSKFIQLRQGLLVGLPIGSFYSVFILCFRYLVASETISSTTTNTTTGNSTANKGDVLKNVLLGVGRQWIKVFGEGRGKYIGMMVEGEQWVFSEVAPEFQQMVDDFSQTAATSTAGEVTTTTNGAVTTTTTTGGVTGSESTPVVRVSGETLQLNNRQYHLPALILMFIKTLHEYRPLLQIPLLLPLLNNHLVELFMVMIGKMNEWMLEGKAVTMGGMKSITAKHLCLVIESYSFLKEFLPVILNNKSGEGEKFAEQCDVFLKRVRERILLIMEERVINQGSVLLQYEWDKPPAAAGTEEEGVMKPLIKETLKLYKITQKYLSPILLKELWKEMFEMYERHLSQTIAKIEIYSILGKNRLLSEVQGYLKEMGELGDGPGYHLEVVVNNLRIRDKTGSVLSSTNTSPQKVNTASTATSTNTTATSNNTTTQKSSTMAESTKKLGQSISASFGKFSGFKLNSGTSIYGNLAGSHSSSSLFGTSSSKDKNLPGLPQQQAGEVLFEQEDDEK